MPTARDYVQDGLVAMWDGIENAGWGVHDPNATVWKDLVGTNNIALTLGDGYWDRDGLNFVGPENGGTYGVGSDIGITRGMLEVVFQKRGNETANIVVSNHYIPLILSDYVGVQKYIQLGDGKGRIPVSSVLDIRHVSAFVDGYAEFAYVDGVIIMADSTTNYWSNMELSKIVFSGYNVDGRGYSFHGKLSCVRIYNLELSSQKVMSNYAIDKARFGLT